MRQYGISNRGLIVNLLEFIGVDIDESRCVETGLLLETILVPAGSLLNDSILQNQICEEIE